MCHPHRCHKGDTWTKRTSHAKVNISLLDERDGSRFSHTFVRNLGERKGRQVCKSVRLFGKNNKMEALLDVEFLTHL